MAATIILGSAFFGIAILGLSLGVIFKKRTPLKGHCHTPVDGSTGCASCGDGAPDACESVSQKRQDLSSGRFEIQKVPAKSNLMK